MLSKFSNKIINLVDCIVSSPVTKIGRAEKYLANSEFLKTKNLNASCFDILLLTINSNGNVYPCCAGLDQSHLINFGNIFNDDINSIVKNMQDNLLLKSLVFLGPSTILTYLKEKFKIEINFYSMCHMCWSIFSNEEYVSELKKGFNL